MFSMSATAPNSARKNQRHNKRRANRESSSDSDSVGGGENNKNDGNAISGADSFVSPKKVNNPLAHRPQSNTPNQQAYSLLLGETTTVQSQALLPPLPPTAPRRSPADDTKRDSALDSATLVISSGASNNSMDDRDEESNGIKRNDSISANIDDMDLLLPNNHYSRLHLSPKQERCSPEMKKKILSLLEKGQQQQHQQQVEEEDGKMNVTSGKTDSIGDKLLEPQSPQLHHPSNYPSNDQERQNSTSHQQELEVCRKRLETEESRASTLSGNDLLNLQQCCALYSTSSSSMNDNNSNIDSNNSAINEVTGDKELRRSGSMEPMVEGEDDEQRLPGDKDEAAITHSSPEKGGCHDDVDNNNIKSKSSQSPPSSSLQAQQQPKSSSPLIYRMYNHSPTSPMSEVNSTLIIGAAAAAAAAAVQGSPCSSTGITPSLFQENDDDDIGGDTYFEEKNLPRPQPFSSLSDDNEERKDGDNDYYGGGIDDLMTPLPPPSVNRMKVNPMECSSTSSTDPTTSASTNTTTTSIAQLAGAPSLPIQSPRRQQTFTPHTHSLLDDCSDEDENDADDDEELSSSYVMIDKQSSSRGISSWKKRNNNNIQIALLQTRHRRWEIQSALCGSHAQSNLIFDLSTRVHYIPKFHNSQQHHFSFSPLRKCTTSVADIDDDDGAFLARLSVPIESIRAGALGSGLWRTVRLVKLPRGLFGWHWLMWKEQRQVPDSVYFGENMPLGNEVWSLLQMLGETFPHLEQIDFGGDIAKSPREEEGINSADAAYNKDEWRNEILTCIMQCLPKLVAVDGFAVEMERGGEEDGPVKSDEMQESSVDGSFGEQHFIKPGRDGQAHTGVGTRKDFRRSSSSFNIPNQCDVATETSDAIEDVSENIMSLCDNYMHSNAHSDEKSILTDHYGPMNESIASEVAPASSPLASSFSWGSAGSSGARPPTCPNSDTRRRLPNKPTIRSKMKSKLSKKNKRRLKKLTGLIPSMMDDDEDSDDDGSVEGAEECPADIL